MAQTTTIQWPEGGDSITATYEGSGNGPIAFSSTPNEGLDRQTVVNVSDGTDTAYVIVNQVGRREKFVAADGDFIVAETGTLNVIKDEFQ